MGAINSVTYAIKSKTYMDIVDESIEKNKLNNPEGRKIFAMTYIIAGILPLLYLLFCTKFIGSFWFAMICFLYAVWSIFDIRNVINYLNNNIISKTLSSKLYRIIGIPLDLGFAIFMLYQVYIRW
jgi:hypothetical protein